MSQAITSPGGAEFDAETLSQKIEETGQLLLRTREAIGQVIYGQNHIVEQSLITLLSGGHALLIGVPGLAYNIFVGAIILGMMALHSWLDRRHQEAS